MVLARWKDLCLDAVDAPAQGRWWGRVLGLGFDPGERAVHLPAERETDGLWINPVPEPKTVKHRVHLDLECGSVQPLLDAGATVLRPLGDDGIGWTVMADPEGGEFCVFTRDALPAALPARRYELVVDAGDPRAQADWWGRVLGRPVVHHDGISSIRDIPGMPFSSLDFVAVPEPKTVKNRVHWDVDAAAVDPLLTAGATILRAPDDDIDWHVLADPEGNEFCVFLDDDED